ncbi:SDR family NAD(P)-dependent oxidoreductase [Candidatus Nitrosocosmicus sp. FF01]|uniref:SDR family NAD(P)-dependent oxidoreductase n=1 Tax=Candidatus Nitrosocosmicus sp. FF01 TaxID=3397670 RepID=UPI0039ED5532
MSLNKDDNRVVIITGLSQGIGQSILKDFVESGTNVLANSPNEQELKKIVSSISDLNDYDNNNRISYLVGDITEKGFAEVLMEEAIKKWGRIDILINNAKITNNPKIKCDDEVISENKQQQREQPSSYFVPEEYETSDPMIRGIYYCIKAAVTRMLSNNDGNATIINISSCQGCLSQQSVNSYREDNFGVDPYVDSMARIETLTKSIALQLADKGIRVNGIVPGLVLDDIDDELVKDVNKRNYKENEVPLGRIAKPQEISRAVLFLASKEASYITGAMIPVDGGLMLKRPNYFVEVI